MTTNIGSLAVSLSLDAASFNGSIDKANRNLGAMGSELRAVRALGTDYGNSLDGLASKKDILTRSVGASSLKLEEERRKYDALVASGTANEAQLERQARRVNEAQAQFNRLTSELSETEQALRRQSSSWHQLSERLGPIGAQLTMVGDKMTAIGKSMSMKVTAPIVAMGTLAAKSAIDFETAFAGVRKTVDATEEEFTALSDGIRGMAKEIPAAATEIAGVAEAAGQLGIEKESILGFTRTMVDLGVATNMSSEEAAMALARLASITNMNQKDFDRLGSSVVGLGNNFATTEGEIVEMALRLAGAGAQVGMSEADILGLAAALSSVGIEAEMGGSAISKAVVRMQIATTTGFTNMNEITQKTGMSMRELQLASSNTPKVFTKVAESLNMTKKELSSVINSGADLKNFAKIAGMSGEEFKQAFENDAVGALGAFINGLGGAEAAGESAINMLQEMGISEVRLRDSLLRAGNASELFAGAVDLSNKSWDENIALTNEAEERYKTTASQLQIMVNYLKELGITLGAIILPVINKMIEGIKPLIEKFTEMSKAAQTTILIIAGIAAAIGPVLVVAGVLISSIGSIVTAISTFAAAMTVVTTGVAALTPGVGMLASMIGSLSGVFTILSGPIGVAVVAIAAVGIGVTKLVNNLNKDALPEVERFGKGVEGISDSTKVALTGFFDLSDGASKSLSEMFLTSTKVTQEMSNRLVAQFSAMNKQIVDEMKANHDEQLKGMKSFFVNSSVLSDEEETKIMQKTKNSNDIELLMQQEKENAIKQIMQTSTNEKRALTERERDTINSIQNEMQKTAVKVLSASEIEQKIIMERLKETASNLSAQQAAEVAKNSAEQRNKSVAEAEAQYTETVGQIIRMRDESGVITEEQATKMIAEATRSKDVTIKQAKNMHEEVVKRARSQAKEHVDTVDWETGEILTKWEVFKNNSTKKFEEIKTANIKAWKNFTTEIKSDIEKLKNYISTNWEEIGQSISTKTKEWKSALTEWWVGLPAALVGVKDTIVNWFVDTGISIAVQLVVWKESIATWFESMPSVMREKLVSWGQAIRQWAEEQNAENIRQFSEWGAAIVNWFTSIPSVITVNLAQWTSSFATWFTDTKTTIVKNFAEWTASIVEWFVSIPSKISENLAKWLTVFAVWFVDTRNAIIKWFADWTSTIVTWFSDTKENIITNLAEWFSAIAVWFKEMPSNIGTWLAEWWTKISTWFSEIPAYLTAKFEDWWEAIKAWFTSVPDKPEIKNMGKNMIDKVAAGNQEKKSELLDKLGKIIVDVALGALAVAGIALVAAGREIIKRLISGIQAMKVTLEAKMKELGDGIVTKMKSVNLLDVGRDIIRGLIKGIGDMATDVWNKAKEIANSIGDAIKETLQIKSPSRITTKAGEEVDNGLIVGMQNRLGAVVEASKATGAAMIKAINTTLVDGTKKANAEVAEIQKKAAEESKKVEQRSAEDVSLIYAKAKKAKHGMTQAENVRLHRLEEDSAAKVKKINEKAAADIAKILDNANKNRLTDITSFISNKKKLEQISLQDEVAIWTASVKQFKKGTDEKQEAMLALRDAKRAVDQEMLESGISYIDEKKRLGEISLADEIRMLDELSTHFTENSSKFETIQKRKAQIIKEVNDDVTKINEKFSSKMIEINKKMADGILQINEDLASKTKSINEKLASDTLKAKEEMASKSLAISERLIADELRVNDEYAKAVDDKYKSLLNASGLFDKFDMSPKQSGDELFENLQSQIEGFESWEEEIAKLSSEAIDEGLLADLRAMGPKALPQLKALNSMTEEQLQEYSAMYQKKSAQARAAAEKQMAGMKEDTQRRLEELRSVANAELAQLNNDTYARINEMRRIADSELALLKTDAYNRITEMRTTANEQLNVLKTDWVKEINNITKATDEEFKSLTQIGKNAGQNLLDGLASMESSLVAKARSIASAVNSALQSTLGGSADIPNISGPTYSGGQANVATASTSKTYNANSTINIYAPTASPSEIARKNEQQQRDLGMQW